MEGSIGGTLEESQRLLWLGALAFYGVGDAATTALGLSTGTGEEVGLVAAPLLAEYGLAALLPLKMVIFALFYAAWALLRTPGRVAVPAALVVVGAVVSCWNAAVVLL